MAPSVSYSIAVRLEVASRSDYPNPISNVLAFPDVVSPDEFGPLYIIPSVLHPDVTSASAVAVAVADVATRNPGR
jgi:malic enzyme